MTASKLKRQAANIRKMIEDRGDDPVLIELLNLIEDLIKFASGLEDDIDRVKR